MEAYTKWLEEKKAHPDKVVLIKEGESYRAYDGDARVLHDYLGVSYHGASRHPREVVLSAASFKDELARLNENGVVVHLVEDLTPPSTPATPAVPPSSLPEPRDETGSNETKVE
jgi:DNA mismatch repair ATPase MutS